MRSAPWIFLAIVVLAAVAAVTVGVVRTSEGVAALSARASSDASRTAPLGPPIASAPGRPTAPEPASAPAPSGGAADAGVPAALADVVLEITEAGRHLAGERIALARTGSDTLELDRSSDVMGFARLSLAPGQWRVTNPTVVSPDFTVGPDGGAFLLKVLRLEGSNAQRVVRGRVIDGSGAPVPLARISSAKTDRLAGPRLEWTVTAEADGAFAFFTDAPSTVLQAAVGHGQTLAESARRLVRPPDLHVTLVMERWVPASVSFPPGGPAWLRIDTENGTTLARSPIGKWSSLPVGVVTLTAQALTATAVCTGRETARVSPEVSAPIAIRPACVEGLEFRVVDGKGTPLPRAQVEIAPVQWPGDTSRRLSWRLRTAAGAGGRCVFRPHQLDGAEPVYELTLLPPWQTQGRVLARLGDEPFALVAVPR